MKPKQVRLADGSVGTIVDEMCACGHKRSDHCDRYETGHGACQFVRCSCEQFSWQAFIFESEV